MMSCEKHLTKTITNIFFLFNVLVFASCTEETRKDDFVARVNESYLTREELSSLGDTSNLDPLKKEQLIKNWIYYEILFQEAQKQGVVDAEDYKKVIKTSARALAAAMIIQNYIESEEIEYSDDELKKYFDKNKNYFSVSLDSYLINKVTFNSEDKAIRFRAEAINGDWEKALNIFATDSSLVTNIKLELIEANNVYPHQLARIINEIYSQEISIVITEKPGYYSVVQMIEKYPKETIPPFEVLKNQIEKRFTAEKRSELIEAYLKELYSNNDIEIKK